MPSPLLQLRIPQDLADWLEAKYPSRGEVAEYVRQLLTAEQMKEAAAPLVPAYDGFGKLVTSVPTSDQYDAVLREVFEAEPKPKARRKKSVKVPDQPVSVMNRGGFHPETQEPSRPDVEKWAEECREDPEIQARTAATISRIRSGNYEKVPVADRSKRPQRCNRGACTGTINPVKGRCVRCNQTPLKESK